MRTKLLKIRISILSAILLLFVCRVQAVYWTEGHHEIYDGNTYDEIWMHNDCTLDIFGGVVGKLAVYDTTITNWYDGQMDTLWARENSIVNIYGGQLEIFMAMDNSLVNLYAYEITHTITGGLYDLGQVTGKYYLDNSSFSFDLAYGDGDVYSHINIVPEPVTFILLALGGFLLRKRNS